MGRLCARPRHACRGGAGLHADHRLGHHALCAGRAGQADRRRYGLEPEPRVRRPHHRPAGVERGVDDGRPPDRPPGRPAGHVRRLRPGRHRPGGAVAGDAPLRLSCGVGVPGACHAHVPLRRGLCRARAGGALARPPRHLLPHAVRRLRLQRVLADRPRAERRIRLAHHAAHLCRHQSCRLPAAALVRAGTPRKRCRGRRNRCARCRGDAVRPTARRHCAHHRHGACSGSSAPPAQSCSGRSPSISFRSWRPLGWR